jgi:predicted ATP-binding protein involved in virulence
MRIDRLVVKNFRKFESFTLDLHPQFTLLVGGNGAGKTSILDALAMCLSLWAGRFQIKDITSKDARSVPAKVADRVQFHEHLPVSVKAWGQIGSQNGLEWEQIFDTGAQWLLKDEARTAIDQLRNGDRLPLPYEWPVIAFYGVTRAALSPDRPNNINVSLDIERRNDAYRHWLNERVDYDELRRWFYREMAAAGANGGRKRPGYEVVRRTVFGCLPEADDLWFDIDQADLICSIAGQAQPLRNLSDGQRMLLAMVADIAIKAVTLNAHLLPSDELGPEDDPLPRVLQKTPGVVLIDELDLHLHPSWQRRVAADLKRSFPSIQFVCTTHSPQIIGELPREQIRIITDEMAYSPGHSFGVDSSRILEEIMGTTQRAESMDKLLTKFARQVGEDDFDGARATLQQAADELGENDPDITRGRTLMAFMEQHS